MKLSVNKPKKTETPASKLASFAKGAPSSGSNSWMTKGRDTAAAVQNVKLTAQRSFAPEVYLKDGESKLLRFRTSECLCSFWQYSFKKGGKWCRFTAPGAGEVDLFKKNGLRPSMKAVWEVVDRTGYVDKQGKKHTNVPRFFLANVKVFENLETIRKKKGGLVEFDIEITRNGTDTKTSYTLLPEEREEFKGIEKIPTIRGNIAKYYAPPSLEEQKALFASYNPADEEDDD